MTEREVKIATICSQLMGTLKFIEEQTQMAISDLEAIRLWERQQELNNKEQS